MEIIYQPKGKAREYSPWTANFYNGCSNRCDYCYNRHCPAKDLLGKDEPTLKKALVTTGHAYDVFCKELDNVKERIIEDGGLHFNFVSDPCLPETWELNWDCIQYALSEGVPCQLLTKRAEVADYLSDLEQVTLRQCQHLLKVGFTLTMRDDLEPYASPNMKRIDAMKRIHEYGIDTWASIEPVIDPACSYVMISKAWNYCNEFRIGLLSGKKSYKPDDIRCFVEEINSLNKDNEKTIIWKESVLKFIEKD